MKTTRFKAIKVVLALYPDLYYDYDTATWYSKIGSHGEHFLNMEVEKAMKTLDGEKPDKVETKIEGPSLGQLAQNKQDDDDGVSRIHSRRI